MIFYPSARMYSRVRLPELIRHSGLTYTGFVFNGYHEVASALPTDLNSSMWKHENDWGSHPILILRKQADNAN